MADELSNEQVQQIVDKYAGVPHVVTLAREVLRLQGEVGSLRGDEYRTHQAWLKASEEADALRDQLGRLGEHVVVRSFGWVRCTVCKRGWPYVGHADHKSDCPLADLPAAGRAHRERREKDV